MKIGSTVLIHAIADFLMSKYMIYIIIIIS